MPRVRTQPLMPRWSRGQAWEPGFGIALHSRIAHELRALADSSNVTVLVTHPGELHTRAQRRSAAECRRNVARVSLYADISRYPLHKSWRDLATLSIQLTVANSHNPDARS